MLSEKMVKRIAKLEKFFNVKQPKDVSIIEWSEMLYDMERKWEEEHQEPFPF